MRIVLKLNTAGRLHVLLIAFSFKLPLFQCLPAKAASAPFEILLHARQYQYKNAKCRRQVYHAFTLLPSCKCRQHLHITTEYIFAKAYQALIIPSFLSCHRPMLLVMTLISIYILIYYTFTLSPSIVLLRLPPPPRMPKGPSGMDAFRYCFFPSYGAVSRRYDGGFLRDVNRNDWILIQNSLV